MRFVHPFVLALVVLTVGLCSVGCKKDGDDSEEEEEKIDTSPGAVCKKFNSLMEEDNQMPEDMCVDMMGEMAKELGEEEWEKVATCVMKADSKEDMDKCEPEKESGPAPAPSGGGD